MAAKIILNRIFISSSYSCQVIETNNSRRDEFQAWKKKIIFF